MTRLPIPDRRTARRLATALLVSFFAHLALILFVRGSLVATGGPPATVLQARLVKSRPMAPSPASPSPAESFEVLPAQVSPSPVPLSQTSPADEPAPPSPPEQELAEPTQQPVARKSAVPATLAKKAPEDAPGALPLPFDPVFYTWREVDVTAKLQGEGRPPYPEAALAAGMIGRVVLEVWVDETGKVEDAKVLEANPPGIFEAATLAYYRVLTFAPALKDGKARRFRGRYAVVFGEGAG